MIIETKDDVVRLSGSLHKNQWITIKAAANLLLHEHPNGIIVDCAGLADISGDGAKTFLEAMRDIEAAHARIIVANLPENVLAVCKTIPGVRSQLPIADSVEAARASLRVVNTQSAAIPSDPTKRGAVMLVPLLADFDLSYGAQMAARIARSGKYEIHLVYLMEVARTLPLHSPLLEEEQAAQEALEKSVQTVRQSGIPVWQHLERVREATDGILTAAKTHNAELLVIGTTKAEMDGDAHEQFSQIVTTLLQRAPCEVVIGRWKA